MPQSFLEISFEGATARITERVVEELMCTAYDHITGSVGNLIGCTRLDLSDDEVLDNFKNIINKTVHPLNHGLVVEVNVLAESEVEHLL